MSILLQTSEDITFYALFLGYPATFSVCQTMRLLVARQERAIHRNWTVTRQNGAFLDGRDSPLVLLDSFFMWRRARRVLQHRRRKEERKGKEEDARRNGASRPEEVG